MLCWLPNGIQGEIPFKYISDNNLDRLEDVKKEVKVGMNVKARISDVDERKFSVKLTTSARYFKKDLWEKEKLEKNKFDDYLVFDNSTNNIIEMSPPSSSQKRNVPREVPKKSIQNRIIDHPFFKNIDYQKTIDYLEAKPMGTAIIRPSSKGNDHLTLSWKFTEKMILHVDIKEEKKSDLAPLSIGKQLIIASNSYEDLDEVLAHYLDPIVLYCQEVFNHRKYNASSPQQIEEFLHKEKEQNASSIPYCISVNERHPGYFDICFIPNKRIHRESFSVQAEGFKYKKKFFTKVSKLLDYFKHSHKESGHQINKHNLSASNPKRNYIQQPSRPRGYQQRGDWN